MGEFLGWGVMHGVYGFGVGLGEREITNGVTGGGVSERWEWVGMGRDGHLGEGSRGPWDMARSGVMGNGEF